CVTIGPFAANTRTSPTITSSNLPFFNRFTSVSVQGDPILPFTLSSQTKFACVTGEDSVKPYPSTNLPPVTRSKFVCTSTGKEAEPLIQALIDDKSYLLILG